MAVKFKDTININGEYTFPLEDGTAGQTLQTDGSGNISFSTIGETVKIACKNTYGSTITKGTPVYVTGTVGASFAVEIAPADASDSAKMPAVGLLETDLANNGEGYIVTGGLLKNLTTDPIDGTNTTSNDTIYVKAGGGLTMTKPTGSNLIQNIGKVGRVNSSNAGSIVVSSILRTNDIPNLTEGKIWVGSANNTIESTVVHIDETNTRVGIGTNSPTVKLEINPSSGDADLILSSNGTQTLRLDQNSIRTTTTNDLTLFTNGNTNQLVLDSGGNVGIGTNSPTTKLHLYNNTATVGLSIQADNASSSDINLGDEDDINIGRIKYDHSTDSMQFQTNNSERMRIESNGSIDISGYGTEGAYLKSKGSFRIDIDNDNDHTDRAFIVSSNNAASDLVTVKENGNVGIGTAPYASTLGNFQSIDLGQSASMWGYLNSVYLNSNAYYNGGWLYKNTDDAGVLQINGSTLTFRQAASGTAGTGISLTDAFSINSSGVATFAGPVISEGPDGGMVMREWTGGSAFGMIGTANMTGNEYALLTSGTNTYIGSGTGGTTHIRGGANDDTPEIRVDGSQVLVRSGGIDTLFAIEGNSTGQHDPVLNFLASGNPITTEGAQIWYDNSVGDLHISTTYANDAADIHFYTRTGTDKGTNNERLTISGNGNIGIGATSPSYNLDFGAGTANLATIGTSDAALRLRADGARSLQLYTNSAERLRIDSSGNVISGNGTTLGNYQFTGSAYKIEGGSSLGDMRFTAPRFRFYDGVGNPTMNIASGNVGIGTTSPSNNLTISQNYAYESSTTTNNNVHIKLQEDTSSTYITNINGITYLSSSPQKGADRGALLDGDTKSATIKIAGVSTGEITFNTGSGTAGTIVSENQRLKIANDGAVSATVDMRAPIFYDYDNTGYYLDPADLSNLDELNIRTVQRWYRSGNNAHQRVDARLDGTDQARMHWYGKDDADATRNFKHAWYDGSSYINVTAASDFVYFQETSGTVSVQADGSFRAPIFYDSDDTTYYIDPAGTSVQSFIKIYSQTPHLAIEDSNNGAGGGAQGIITFRNTGGKAIGIGYTGNETSNSDLIISTNAASTYGGYLGLDAIAILDTQADIILDPKTDIRAYGNLTFGTPGGGANTTGRFVSIEGNTDTSGEGSSRIFFAEHNSTTAAMDNYGMSIAYRGGGTSITGASGNSISISALGNGYWGLFGHNNSINGNLAMFGFRDGSYVQATGSFRAPIFYDSDDTSYYVNPAGTSNIHSYNRGLAEVAGWVPAYSNSDPDTVRWNTTENATELQSSSDSTTGAAFRAIRVKSGQTIRITLTVRASTAASSGFYIRGYQYDGNMPDGKTHVSNSASYSFVQEDTSGTMSWGVENAAISTAWTTYEKEFLITADGYFSVVVLNWSGMGFNSLYLKTPTYDVVQIQQGIYYDNDATAYYVDPGSTSRFVTTTTDYANITDGAEYAVRFWGGNHNYSIRMSQSSNSTYGGRVAGETTSDYNMYFTMSSGTNRGFVFRNANASSGTVAGIDASGNGRFIGDVVAYSSSDERLKDNKKNIDNALEKVESLNGVEFDWNDKQDVYSGHDVGIIAQEVEKVLPEIVNTRDTGYKAVKYEKLVPLLIEAVKELSEKVKMLENK